MRALLSTALALAFALMAVITYVAVTQDPLAGEPRVLVEVTPPDLAKLQPKVVPAPAAAPVATVPAPAAIETTSVTPNAADASAVALKDPATAPAQPVADLARAAENAGAPAQPVAAAKSAIAVKPAPLIDDSVEGASVVIPQ